MDADEYAYRRAIEKPQEEAQEASRREMFENYRRQENMDLAAIVESLKKAYQKHVLDKE